jgi:thiol-disulfide isomerase/thioredoxin
MKNPVVIFAIIAVVVILGYGAYTLSQNYSKSNSMMQKDESGIPTENTAMDKTDDAAMKVDGTMQKSNDRYVEYSQSVLDNAAANRRVLFFFASWCPTCKPTDLDLKANSSEIPSDVTVIRVNYNDPETDQIEKDLAKKYGVTYQHTFVQIDGQGNEITKWNGGKTAELLAKLK